MGAYLYWTSKEGATQILWFDVVTDEQHHLKATATEFPVEDGANISDHVRPDLDHVTLQAFVSNEPIITRQEVQRTIRRDGNFIGVQSGNPTGVTLDVKTYEPKLEPTPGAILNFISSAIGNLLAGRKQYKALVLEFPDPFDNVKDVYEGLRTAMRDGLRVNIVTGVRTYTDMVIEDVNLTKNAATGTGATFSVECKEIRIVSTTRVPVPKVPVAAKKKDLGAKGPTPPPNPKDATSALRKMTNYTGITAAGQSDQ